MIVLFVLIRSDKKELIGENKQCGNGDKKSLKL